VIISGWMAEIRW